MNEDQRKYVETQGGLTDVVEAASKAIDDERVSEIYEEQNWQEADDPDIEELESEEDNYDLTEGVKSPGQHYVDEEQTRYHALNFACATLGPSQDKNVILDAADSFHRFLKGETTVDRPEYPYRDGDVIVLGPETFVGEQGRVISWRGMNYYIRENVNS